MASETKQVQFQEAPGDENPLVVFNKGVFDRARQRKLSRTFSGMSMGSIKLHPEDEEEGLDRDESVVSLIIEEIIYSKRLSRYERANPHFGLIFKVIPLKLFLDMVPTSSVYVTSS